MKKLLNIFLVAASALGIASCSQEAPFQSGKDGDGQGRVLTNSLSVELKTDETLVRSSATPDVSEFAIDFYNVTDQSVAANYTYGEMPEVVTLPVGIYMVRAYYGGNYGSNGETAAFNAPYYLGESEEFSVEKDKIVDNIKPIVCKLSNVKVTILFDTNLVSKMSSDSKVTVTVGNGSSLNFEANTQEAGYFAFDGTTTLLAEFNGTVEGDIASERKTYSNVAPGKHYRITFKLHSIDPNEPGHINAGEQGEEIKVDASVDIEDLVGDGAENIDPTEEIFLEDDRYPTEDPVEPNNPDDPNTGDDPNNPDDPTPPSAGGPTVAAEEPIILEDWNVVTSDLHCVLNVHSESGITGFTVKIDSETLTEDVLSGVGLSTSFDLINPGSMSDGLASLGLPVEGKVNGQNDVKFDISSFMALLGIYGAADHRFILTVSDVSGTTVVTLKLRTE